MIPTHNGKCTCCGSTAVTSGGCVVCNSRRLLCCCGTVLRCGCGRLQRKHLCSNLANIRQVVIKA